MGSSRIRALTWVACIGRRILNHCTTREVPEQPFLMLSAVRYFQKHPPNHECAWVCSLSCNLCSCSRPSSRSSVAAVVPMVVPDVPDPSPAGCQQSREHVNTAQAELRLALGTQVREPLPGPVRGRATPSFAIRKPREKVEKTLQGCRVARASKALQALASGARSG